MNNFAKTRIVIVGVKAGLGCGRLQPATYDAPGTTAALSRCPDGVFTVISANTGRKQPFPIAKYHAILVMPEGATLVNQCQHAASLGRQLGNGHCFCGRLRERAFGLRRAGVQTRHTDQGG